MDLMDLLPEHVRDYMRSYLPIGIEKMNQYTALRRGEMLAIAGRPGFGKTSLACRMIYNLAVEGKYRIGIFSLKMKSNDFAKRVLHKRFEEKKDYDYVRELSEVSENRIWIDDTPVISVSAIKNKCYEMKKKQGGLDYIFIDYFQIVSVDKEQECYYEQERSLISRELKNLSKELACAIVVTTQLPRRIDEDRLELRPNKSRRPSRFDFRETILEHDTDVAIFLYRDEMYYPNSAYKGKVEAILGKNRGGPVDVSFFFDIETEL